MIRNECISQRQKSQGKRGEEKKFIFMNIHLFQCRKNVVKKVKREKRKFVIKFALMLIILCWATLFALPPARK